MAPPPRPALVDDEQADQLLGKARAESAELLGTDGLLSQVTKPVLERALAEDMTGHLGYEKYAKVDLDVGAPPASAVRVRSGRDSHPGRISRFRATLAPPVHQRARPLPPWSTTCGPRPVRAGPAW